VWIDQGAGLQFFAVLTGADDRSVDPRTFPALSIH
jgi:hypothetical protein